MSLLVGLLFASPGQAAPLLAQFIWQGAGTLNGETAGSVFILEQPYDPADVIAGPTAGSWRWTAPTTSLPATILGASSGVLTLTEKLTITVDSNSVRLTAASGLGVGYFGSLGGFDLKSTKDAVALTTDPFGAEVFLTDQGSFVGFNRASTAFGVGIADSVVGDYSDNGLIDAADYTVWRDMLGADTLPNRSSLASGLVGPEDFEYWKTQYGGWGSASRADAVPETGLFVLVVGAGLGLGMFSNVRPTHTRREQPPQRRGPNS
ncbi:MAG: hypothetical protein AB7G28_15840 [Pirellulales bacterium]